MPESNAWPMPSPVSTSVTQAASPTNNTLSTCSVVEVTRAGIGQALNLSSSTAVLPRAWRTWSRDNKSAHTAFMSPGLCDAPRKMPKPMLTRPSANGNDHAYPGNKSGSNHTYNFSLAGPVTWWAY